MRRLPPSPAWICFGLALLLTLLGTWPLALDLGGSALDGAYWGNQAWSVFTASEALWSGESLTRTRAAGWPGERELRHLGWLVLLAGAALKPLLSAVVVTNLALILGPPLSAGVMSAWLRRLLPQASPAALVFAGLSYGLSPHFICNLANAEAAKAQFWLVPALLWACMGAGRSWRGLPLAWVCGLTLAFTEPYGFMVALFALPVLALFIGERGEVWRWLVLVLGLGALGLLAKQYFTPPDLPLSASIYAPASAPHLATERLELPFSSAPLLAMLQLPNERAPSGTQHGVYVGWALLCVAAWGARRPDRLAGLGLSLAGLGLVSAMGPLLFLGREQPTGIPLPMMLAEWLHLPIASGGMYYRLLHVGLLGLAILAARAPLGLGSAGLASLIAGVELSRAVLAGLPLPVSPLPFPSAAAAMRADPQPGAVMTLPAYPEGVSSKEWAFRFAVTHGRPITDLPRRPDAPADWPPLAMNLDRCVGPDPRCEVPQALGTVLEQAGIRYLVLWEAAGQDTTRLRAGLERRLGAPVCADSLCWWTLNNRPPSEVPIRPVGGSPGAGGRGGPEGARKGQNRRQGPPHR